MSNYGVCSVCQKPAEGDGGKDIIWDEQRGYMHFDCTFEGQARAVVLKGGPYDGEERTVETLQLVERDLDPDGEPMGYVIYKPNGKKGKKGREIFEATQRWVNPDGQ